MPKNLFPNINYSYKRILREACPSGDTQCYIDVLSNTQTQPYIEVIGDIWNTLGESIFPELCPNFVNSRSFNPDGVSIAVSGGGTIAYSSMIGYIRALLELEVSLGKNAFTSSQFISTVSGGSWFTGTYVMAKGTNKYSDSELLGANIDVTNINYESLNTVNFDNKNFMGQRAANAPVIPYMLEGFKKGIQPEFLWNYAVGKIFLSNYNLFGVNTSQNDYYASIMKRYNPSLPYPNLPPVNYPFWVCNASLLDTNIINNGATQIQLTPFYSGFHQLLGSNSDNTLIGGTWINTYAFGSIAPKKILSNIYCEPNKLKLKVPKYQGGPLTLENMIGTSSAAYAYITDEIAKTYFGQLVKFDPIYNFVCAKTPSRDRLSLTGDGGIVDDTGIMNLVARNCKYIISFNSNNYSYETSPGVYDFCNSGFMPLFGVYTGCSTTGNQPNNSVQIFPSSEWASFSQKFIDAISSGGPCYARAQLPVLPNPQNGVKGNYIVDLIVITLQPSTTFNSLLPTNISETFNDTRGPFPNFPTYALIGEDPLRLVQLSKSQINLLQCYTYWSIMSNNIIKQDIIDMYTQANIF